MKKLSLSVAMFMLSVGILFAQGKIHTRAFTGAIMDSQCTLSGCSTERSSRTPEVSLCRNYDENGSIVPDVDRRNRKA